jgi:hypothetical protein
MSLTLFPGGNELFIFERIKQCFAASAVKRFQRGASSAANAVSL